MFAGVFKHGRDFRTTLTSLLTASCPTFLVFASLRFMMFVLFYTSTVINRFNITTVTSQYPLEPDPNLTDSIRKAKIFFNSSVIGIFAAFLFRSSFRVSHMFIISVCITLNSVVSARKNGFPIILDSFNLIFTVLVQSLIERPYNFKEKKKQKSQKSQ